MAKQKAEIILHYSEIVKQEVKIIIDHSEIVKQLAEMTQ